MAEGDHPAEELRALGQRGEGPHDIARSALLLAALDHPDRQLAPYEAHLMEISEAAQQKVTLCTDPEDGARAVAQLLAGVFGYDGDRLTYDDPRNADLIAVIETRRGLPVALGILYLHAARAAGWEAAGLSSPGHFLLQVGFKGAYAVADPFNGGAALERERLHGPPVTGGGELDGGNAGQPVSDAEVLLRLQNNLKLRALAMGDGKRALQIAERMILIAPKNPDLWVDLARLNEVVGALGAAKRAYEACLALSGTGADLHNEAALALHAIKRRLH